ncbi:MAG: TlpA family protein disulfide reductase [Spirochaetia bacterium]
MTSFGSSVSIGPLTVPVPLIIAAAATGVGYLVFALLMKKDTERRKRSGAALVNGGLIFLLVWKLSPLIFRFSAVIDSPLLLLYTWGGVPGIILAAAAALGYMALRGIRARRRGRLEIRTLLGPAIFGFTAAAVSAAAVFLVIFLSFGPRPLAEGARNEAATGIGVPAPDVKLLPLDPRESLEGGEKTVRLSDYRGRTVFLNFWATWCPPCRAEIPELERFVEELDGGPNRAVVLAVNLTSTEKSAEAVERFVDERDISFPVFLDPNGAVAAVYEVESVPTTYAISPEGIIIAEKTGVVSVPWLLRQLD